MKAQEKVIKDLDDVLANLDYSNQEKSNKIRADYEVQKKKLQNTDCISIMVDIT